MRSYPTDTPTSGLIHGKSQRAKIVIGSHNFSASAEEVNDENVVILFSEDVAKVYLQEVARVVGEAGK